MPNKQARIVIPIEVGENYQDSLVRRLREYGITQRELAAAMGIHETQLSRWLVGTHPASGKRRNIRMDKVIEIERALVLLRTRMEKQRQNHTKEQDGKRA